MSGVTSRPFRRLIKSLNGDAVDLTVTEFISVEGLTRDSFRSHRMLQRHSLEVPFCVQIFGYDIKRMRDAAVIAVDSGADLIDINCGCPAPKVVKRGGGAELMRQPDHLRSMLKEVRQALKVPLSIKIRSGWDETSKNAIEIAKMAADEGCDTLTIHGRTRAQLYRGVADWTLVEEVVHAVPIPVYGSGDVTDHDSLAKAASTGVLGVFIGRQALIDPLIFSRLKAPKEKLSFRDGADLKSIVLMYLRFLLEDFTPEGSVGKLKQLVSQMGDRKRNPWVKEFCRFNSLSDQEALLQSL
jgi:nifR3 family TIM-barrel protein